MKHVLNFSVFKELNEKLVNIGFDPNKFFILSPRVLSDEDLQSIRNRSYATTGYWNVLRGDGSLLDGSEVGFSAHHDLDYVYELNLEGETVIIPDEQSDEELKKIIIAIRSSEDLTNKLMSLFSYDTFKPVMKRIMDEIETIEDPSEVMDEELSFESHRILGFIPSVYFTLHPETAVLKLKVLNPQTYVNLQRMSGVKLVADKNSMSSERDPEAAGTLDSQSMDVLQKFMGAGGKDIPKNYWPNFRYAGLVGSAPIKLYRALSWSPENLYKLKNFSSYPFHLNDVVSIKNSRANSWTTNTVIASNFKDHDLAIIVEYTANPDDVIVDTRLIAPETRKRLYRSFQREVILKPGTYKAKIVEITVNGQDQTSGFEGYDPTVFKSIESNFNAFAKKFIKQNNQKFDSLSYVTKNQSIFGDYAVEVPLIKIGKNSGRVKGVVEVRYSDGKFILKMNNWTGGMGSFSKVPYESSEELIDALNQYVGVEAKILQTFL